MKQKLTLYEQSLLTHLRRYGEDPVKAKREDLMREAGIRVDKDGVLHFPTYEELKDD